MKNINVVISYLFPNKLQDQEGVPPSGHLNILETFFENKRKKKKNILHRVQKILFIN